MSRLRPSFPWFRLAPIGATGTLGPASSTDNAIVRWDGTDGATLQNSVVIIADTTGNMSSVGTLASGAITSTGASSMGSLTLTTDLAVADGGTGLSSGTSGGILGYTATGTLASSALLTLNGILLGGGAGATPTATAAPTSGQVLIGSTGVAPVLALIGGGENITVTSGAGSVSVAVTGTISLTRGGTNAALTASNGGIVYSTASALAILAGTATADQILRSGASGAPTWSTSTYPATNAVSTLLYASSANVMAALATANSGVLVTSGTGVPSIATDIPTAVTIGGGAIYRVGGTDVAVADGGTGVSTLGDAGVLIGNGTAAVQVTGAGTSGQVLTSNGAGVDPTFQAAAAGATVGKHVHTLPTHVETGITKVATGGGVVQSTGAAGMRCDTSATATSSIDIQNDGQTNQYNQMTGNNHFGMRVMENATGTDVKSFMGFGVVTVNGSDITYAGNHYGFKRNRAASVLTVSATNADGTTETATSYTDAFGALFMARKTGSTEIVYYVNRTSVATHTTNIPTTNVAILIRFAISNIAVATNTAWTLMAANMTWEGQ